MKELCVDARPFVRGIQIGNECRETICRNISQFRKELDEIKEFQGDFAEKLQENLEETFPVAMDELLGMANGSNSDFGDIFLFNVPELWGRESGCTSVAVRDLSRSFIIHNEDEENWRRPDDYILVRAMREKQELFAAICTPPELPGNAAAWTKNIFFSVDCMTPRAKLVLDDWYIPRFFEARSLISKKSIREACRYLRFQRSMSAFHYLIGEFGTGKIVSVEKFHNETSVKPVDSLFFHANHPVHKPFARLDFAEFSENSIMRMTTAKANIKPGINKDGVVSVMKNKLWRPIDKNDDRLTFATVFADLKRGVVSLVE